MGFIFIEDNIFFKSDLDRYLNDNGNFSLLFGIFICFGGYFIIFLEEFDMLVEVVEIGVWEENFVMCELGVFMENKSYFLVDVVGVVSD